MMATGPMLLVIRRPTTKLEWAVSIGCLLGIAYGGFCLLDPVVQAVFATQTKVAVIEERTRQIDGRLGRVEAALMQPLQIAGLKEHAE
jgi:hypothetical protein